LQVKIEVEKNIVLQLTTVLETFALSPNRAQDLKELVAGSEDYFYYNILNKLNDGMSQASKSSASAGVGTSVVGADVEKEIETLLNRYRATFGNTSRFKTLETRFHLLQFGKKKEQVFKWIQDQLSIRFYYHQEKGAVSTPSTHPNLLDQGNLRFFFFFPASHLFVF